MGRLTWVVAADVRHQLTQRGNGRRFVLDCERIHVSLRASHEQETFYLSHGFHGFFYFDSHWLLWLRANPGAISSTPDGERLGQFSDTGLWSARMLYPHLPS
jgi:hypothetical protein